MNISEANQAISELTDMEVQNLRQFKERIIKAAELDKECGSAGHEHLGHWLAEHVELIAQLAKEHKA